MILQRWSWLLALLILLGVSFHFGNTPAAHATSANVLPSNGVGTPPLYPVNYPNTTYTDIQYHPKIYLVFWGSKWDNDTDGVIPQVQATFKALAGSGYNDVLTQYTDGTGNPTGYVHNDVQLMGTWIDNSSSSLPSYIDITNEVGDEEKKAVSHFGLPYGNLSAMRNIQIIVFPQNGTSYISGGSFCGMHYYDGTSGAAYGLVQYSRAGFCDPTGNIAQDMSWFAVHEYAETATDRVIYGTVFESFFGNGWQTHDNSWTPDEVADLCEGYAVSNSNAFDDYYSTKLGQYFSLPYLWSNADNGCVTSASFALKTVAIAQANLGKRACSTNSAGGTSYYSSCTGNGGLPEYWCSDFARWVWSEAGVNTSGLTAAAGSFGFYGTLQSTPKVGDAVLFNYNGNGYADHVALVVQVNSNGTIVTIGGDENGQSGSESYWSSTSSVVKDGPYSGALGYSSYWGMSISGYVAPKSGGGSGVIPAPPGGSSPPSGVTVPSSKWWITTFANAPGYGAGQTQDGTLYAGTNYVYCKEWGKKISDSSGAYNHWWMWTDLDTGGQGWVSAYYLSKWGNDQAKDNSGNVIPDCWTGGSGSPGSSGTIPGAPGGSASPSGVSLPTTKRWITTFANATGYGGGWQQVGTLYAGTNYVYCKEWGAKISDSSGSYNHWWMWTDLDTGGQGWVSAYYLSKWGNDVAKDNSGNVIPNCWSIPAPPGSSSAPTSVPSTKWWVTTFANAPGYGGGWRQVGTLYAGTNYVYCKEWGAKVSDSSGNYNHYWLWTDLDTGGQGWVSAYYLSKWGNDVAKDNSGNVIPTC